MPKTPITNRGFSLVEVIAVSAILILVFGALFASFEYSLRLINTSRAKLSAISVANDRMEYFRSLPYASVGTIAGIPPGSIPPNGTTSLNGIVFTERVLVEYVDDEADGQDTATTSDSNGIPSDYKRIRLEYSWSMGGTPGSITMISNIVPRSVETTSGGGTVRINVIDENSQLVPGASVRLINENGPIDVTRLTDAGGTSLISGAPAGSGYEVIVTGPISGYDYSIDQTYVATTSLPNPVKAPFTVIEADVSTLTFQIGRLSDLIVKLKSSVSEGYQIEEFSDLMGLASSSQVASDGTGLTLSEAAGVYDNNGFAYLAVNPASVIDWGALTVAASLPSGASYRTRLFTGSGTGPFTLIPETDLPGNAAGFDDSIIDLSDLSAITYPSFVIGVFLETTNSATTPKIDEIGVFYRESEVVLANQDFSIRGEKIIGTDASALPVYKYNISTTTDSDGELVLRDMEFDLYTLTLPAAYDVALGCPSYPFTHQAGVDGELELLMVTDETHSLRLSVVDESGRAVPGAQAELTRSGFNETQTTNACGQVFFPGTATAQVDYEITVSAAGYQDVTVSNLTIDGDVELSTTLSTI